jgi:hypothetical protein
MGNVDTSSLISVMQASMQDMKIMMESSINYQTRITEITTYLGQVAARAAKQMPQG